MKQILQNARWIGLALAALGIVISSECTAGPLVLRGTAIVATVYDDFVYEGTVRRLPFATHVGDTFSFLLTIEPQKSPAAIPGSSAIFRAVIGGANLHHSLLEVFVSDNSDLDVFFWAEPVIADVAATVGDQIRLGRSASLGEPAYVGSSDIPGAPRFRVDIGFLEGVNKNLPDGTPQPNCPSLLNDTSVPRDATTWQAFTHRELALSFENLGYVGAYIRQL